MVVVRAAVAQVQAHDGVVIVDDRPIRPADAREYAEALKAAAMNAEAQERS